MKQIVILSGKGGTGKTSVSAAFAHLSSSLECSISPVFVDADVDAANLSLVLTPEISQTSEFWGGSLAEIDAENCLGCGSCVTVCRYDAVVPDAHHKNIFVIDPIACDGCAACVYACQQNAISMIPQQEGHWYRSNSPYGTLFHAELFPGKENSGKLVTLIKQQAKLWAEEYQSQVVIVDGPPGIGCPVISACAGADLGFIVTEPSLSGLHDLKRVLETLNHFRVPTVICINKADLYLEGTRQIKEFAASEGIEVLGEIPFDEHIVDAMLQGSPVTSLFSESPASQAINQIWKNLYSKFLVQKESS
jgi:MinD superfamily P-loop ATPase